jgi:translation initiation factor 1
MRPEKAKKIAVNPDQAGLAGLGNALAGLNLGPLPDGPDLPAAPVGGKVKKPGRVVLRKETAHRGGKAVIVVHDFPPHFTDDEIEVVAKQLRKSLGTGGTVRERTIEMQGDQSGKIRDFLESQGWQVAGV